MKIKRNIALLISYDGTDFAGWQKQDGQRSVQQTIEEALASLHQRPLSLYGAGRTDAGVHAVGQVANFYTEKDTVADWQFRDALNAYLPRDVQILQSARVHDSFHARKDALSRHYEYRIMEGYSGMAHARNYAWLIRRCPSLRVLNDMAREICGVHDFTTFTVAGDKSPSRIREIHHAVFLSRGPLTLFRICGNAFLWKMVRSLVGTLLDAALRGGGSGSIQDILKSCDRRNAGPTAPARGLFLSKVEYEPERFIN